MITLSPSRAIKVRCKDCLIDSSTNICLSCQLNSTYKNLYKIKHYCKDYCLNGYSMDHCNSIDCSLYSFRNGHNPNRSGIGGYNTQNMRKIVP